MRWTRPLGLLVLLAVLAAGGSAWADGMTTEQPVQPAATHGR